jgi:hypothetical protein
LLWSGVALVYSSSNSYYFIPDGVVATIGETNQPKITTKCFPLIRRQGFELGIREKVTDNSFIA